MTHYVGIDVTKATLEVAEECTGKSQRYPNTAEGRDKLLKALIAHDGHVQVVLEPTSTYHQHIVDGDMIESGVWRGWVGWRILLDELTNTIQRRRIRHEQGYVDTSPKSRGRNAGLR